MKLIKLKDVILNLNNVTQIVLTQPKNNLYRWLFITNNSRDLPVFSDIFESKKEANKWLKDALQHVENREAHEVVDIEED